MGIIWTIIIGFVAKAPQPLRSIFLVHREIHSPLYSRPRPAGA
jgi:hypothetical protein